MVAFYVKLVTAGKLALDNVPEKFRGAVKAALEH